MQIIPVPNQVVRQYLLSQPNKADDYPTDATGRFLLPMDEVYYGFATDEGPEVMIMGTVVTTLTNHTTVKNNSRFAKSFGIEYSTVANKRLVKLPPPLTSTRSHLVSYFAGVNSILSATSHCHIRGRSIC